MRIVFAFLHYSILFYICIAIMASWWIVMRLRRAAGIWNLRYYAFPRPWLKYLHKNVPLYSRLPLELRAPFQDHVVQFVDSKLFRPCGRMEEVNWAEQVSIAGNACLLLLNSVDPHTFTPVMTVQLFQKGDEDAEARLNCVALWWDPQTMQATDPRDRDRTALAAFASKLGWEVAGRPALPDTLLLAPWARVRSSEFMNEHPGVLEKAGLEESSEAFAVATEMFYHAPALLLQRAPVLYESMRRFYRIDPARWKKS